MQVRLERVLARQLRKLAADRDLPLSHVADRAGIARSYLWRLLRAQSSASLATLQRLAVVLEIDPLELLSAPGDNGHVKGSRVARSSVR
ncbi:MAG: helix-turn-helix transcriptional regulator [Deltaproteobacteria bacterium]|nr:helix-turn-helix transcriptional regulator [Deltaproteobacteria bacterium]